MTVPRRVAVAHRNLAYGGAERVLVEQVRALARWPCAVDVWATRKDDPLDLEPEIRAANPHVRGVAALDGTTPLAWRLLKGRYDLLLTSIGRSPWRALHRLRRVPFFRRPAVIATLHAPHEAAVAPLRPWAAQEVDVVLLMYEFREEAAAALGVPASRLAVARPFFSSVLLRADDETRAAARALRASWGATESSVVLGFFGRIAPEKGLPHVIRMAGRLAEAGKDVHLVIAGQQSREHTREGRAFSAELEAARRGAPRLEGRLHMPGPMRLAAPVYGAFDLTVLCSSMEGVALMLWESLSVGTPILATATGGLATLLKDGVDAALVRKQPDDGSAPGPEALAALEARLRALVEDPAERRRLGAAGQARVEAIVAGNDFAGDFLRAVEQAMQVRDERG